MGAAATPISVERRVGRDHPGAFTLHVLPGVCLPTVGPARSERAWSSWWRHPPRLPGPPRVHRFHAPTGDTWPLDRYGLANTAGNTAVTSPTDPTISWETATGTGANAASIVIGPDMVYVGGNAVAALDRHDGTVRWTRDLREYTLGWGAIRCVSDRSTGMVRWG